MKPEKPSELYAINGLKELRPGEHTFFVNEIINFGIYYEVMINCNAHCSYQKAQI